MFLEEDSHLADVQEALHGTDPKWMAIGIQLRIPNAKLTKIAAEHQYANLEDCNRRMQIAWLKTGKATWADLVKALRTKSVGLPEVANSIESLHIRHDNGSVDHDTVPSEVNSPTESLSKNERLGEIMEWLLKMGFTLEDISKWISDKRKSPSTSGARAGQAATNLSKFPTSEKLQLSSQVSMICKHHVFGCAGKELPKAQLGAKKRSSVSRTKLPRAKRSRSEGFCHQAGVTALAAKCPMQHRSSMDSGTKRMKRRNMLDDMMTILEELEKIDEAEEFIDHVEKERAEDYDDVIETPMYLTKMKNKVKYGDYDTPQEFLDDFDLIIRNCEEYNGPDSDLMEQANELEAKFKELCSEHLPDDSDYSRLEKIPSDADSSEESEESTRDNNPEQEGELDQSLSTEIGEDDEDWTPPHSGDEN